MVCSRADPQAAGQCVGGGCTSSVWLRVTKAEGYYSPTLSEPVPRERRAATKESGSLPAPGRLRLTDKSELIVTLWVALRVGLMKIITQVLQLSHWKLKGRRHWMCL